MKKSVFKTTIAFAAAFAISVSITASVFAAPPPQMPEGKGDINCDGFVDYIDTLFLRKYIAGEIKEFPTPDGFAQADVDSNGKIDSEDLMYFLLGVQRLTYGDLNDDGKISSTDALLLQKDLLQNTKYDSRISFYLRDLNADGKVNVIDLLLLKQYVLGVIDEFPITQYIIPDVPEGVYP